MKELHKLFLSNQPWNTKGRSLTSFYFWESVLTFFLSFVPFAFVTVSSQNGPQQQVSIPRWAAHLRPHSRLSHRELSTFVHVNPDATDTNLLVPLHTLSDCGTASSLRPDSWSPASLSLDAMNIPLTPDELGPTVSFNKVFLQQQHQQHSSTGPAQLSFNFSNASVPQFNRPGDLLTVGLRQAKSGTGLPDHNCQTFSEDTTSSQFPSTASQQETIDHMLPYAEQETFSFPPHSFIGSFSDNSTLPSASPGPSTHLPSESSPFRREPIVSKAIIEINDRHRRHPARPECPECQQTFTSLFALKREPPCNVLRRFNI